MSLIYKPTLSAKTLLCCSDINPLCVCLLVFSLLTSFQKSEKKKTLLAQQVLREGVMGGQ